MHSFCGNNSNIHHFSAGNWQLAPMTKTKSSICLSHWFICIVHLRKPNKSKYFQIPLHPRTDDVNKPFWTVAFTRRRCHNSIRSGISDVKLITQVIYEIRWTFYCISLFDVVFIHFDHSMSTLFRAFGIIACISIVHFGLFHHSH